MLANTKFMFATGMENSYPTIILPGGTRKRVDEMAKANHYQLWENDLDLVRQLGIFYLRYGPPYYATHTAPGQYDWNFSELTFNRIRELKITPIVDLCHFGVPDWLDNFQNPDFPQFFAEYAKAFAQRFPYLELYTPINEIFITALFSAQYGWWNECLQSDAAFVNAIKNLCKANVMAMHAILEVQPKAIFIQSESSEFFHALDPQAQKLAFFLNRKRFLSLDLTYGYRLDSSMYEYLLDNGMKREEYHWFLNNTVKARCIMGNDYYETNEHLVNPDGTIESSGEIFGYYVITQQYFRRYRLPIMHTETNIKMPYSVFWLKKQMANVHRLKYDGVPIVGFTWYSLLDQIDWDSALCEDAGRVNNLGLFDLDRKITPVGKAYQEIIEKWTDVIDTESYGLLFNY